jgi:hypothetical protein
MTFGLSVKNANGDVQIDSLYKEYGVKAWGTAYAQNDLGAIQGLGAFNYIPGVDSQNGYPSLMIKATPYSVGRMPYEDPVNHAMISSGFLQPVQYVILDDLNLQLPISGASNYGVKVFNPSGLTVFDSRRRHFFLDQIAYIYIPENFNNYDFTMPAPEFGSRYFQAVVRGSGGEYGDQAGVFITELSANSYRINANRTTYDEPGIGINVLSGYFLE